MGCTSELADEGSGRNVVACNQASTMRYNENVLESVDINPNNISKLDWIRSKIMHIYASNPSISSLIQ
jgi:hypothetical protein